MRFDIITIFPKIFSIYGGSAGGGDSYLNAGILARAQAKNLVDINIHDLRDWAEGAHRQVDDSPFGGGPGMVLKVEPIFKAVKDIVKSAPHTLKLRRASKNQKIRVILLSAKGKTFIQNDAKRLSKYKQIVFICGRYEGVDERVAKYVADEEISIGDYVRESVFSNRKMIPKCR